MSQIQADGWYFNSGARRFTKNSYCTEEVCTMGVIDNLVCLTCLTLTVLYSFLVACAYDGVSVTTSDNSARPKIFIEGYTTLTFLINSKQMNSYTDTFWEL